MLVVFVHIYIAFLYISIKTLDKTIILMYNINKTKSEGCYMLYTDNKELKLAFQKMLLDEGISQAEVARRMGMSGNQLSGILNKKKNLSFEDINKMLNACGYSLVIDFVKK